MRPFPRAHVFVLSSALVLAPSALASGPCDLWETQKLLPTATSQETGHSVAIDGDVALVGSPKHGLSDRGGAYVYRRTGSTWQQEQFLSPPGLSANARFGWSVDLSGDVAVLGAYYHSGVASHSGSAFVYRYQAGDWVLEQELSGSGTAADDWFGYGVAVQDDVIAVASFFGDGAVAGSGTVTVFRRSGSLWIEEQVIAATDLAYYDVFGWAISLDDDVLAIGTPRQDGPGGGDAGAAYVYRRVAGSWILEDKIVPTDLTGGDVFGQSIDVRGDRLVVGAPLHGLPSASTGAAYVYQRSGTSWLPIAKLQASASVSYDYFGTDVAQAGDAVLASATGVQNNAGAVHVFRSNGTAWVEVTRLVASDGVSHQRLGKSVAACGDQIVVGSYHDPQAGSTAGSTYFFDYDELALEVEPAVAPGGSPVTLTTCGGIPSTLALLYLMEVNGLPTVSKLAQGVFSAAGGWSLTGTVDSSLTGLTLALQTFGFSTTGKITTTNRAELVIP